MTTNVSGFPAVAAPNTSARESRREDDEGQSSFAGVFAGATQAQARPVRPVEKKEGTSELDRSSDADDRGDADDVSETKGDDKAQVASLDPAMVGTDRAFVTIAPALQEQLGRLTARMGDVAGKDAQATETYGGQPRQGAPVAQEPWAPSSVVTWTLISKRTQDVAVDLLLQRTLGERDPGHLELPTNSPEAMPDATGDPGVVSVDRLTQLAPAVRLVDVKNTKPADVARIASVAGPDISSSITKPSTTTSPPPVDASAVVARSDASVASQRFGANSEDRGGKNGNEGDASAYGVGLVGGKHTTTQFSIPSMATDLGSTATQRAAHVLAAREDAPARPLSQIVMNVDAGNGTTDRIQVDLRGSSLSATIDAADLHAAHAMSARSSELVRALTRDGLDVESFQVRAAASLTGPSAADASQRPSDSSSNSRFERGAQWQEQQHRQRSEDERRQQQRDERGGKES
jgi:hypothetical protein